MSVQPHYYPSDDLRIASIQKTFEEAMSRCPAGGWQNFRITRKPDNVTIEIVTSFKFQIPTEEERAECDTSNSMKFTAK